MHILNLLRPLLLGAAALLWACAIPALAHDWYPLECCSSMDCAPVEHSERLTGPATANLFGRTPSASLGMLVTSKYGTVLVPADFPRRESKDNRQHVCMRPTSTGQMKLLCIFDPPGS
jgi:hypothetical protein